CRAIQLANQVSDAILKPFDKLSFEVGVRNLVGELDRPACILKDLGSLYSRHLVEEPAAARKHEHGMSLHFKQPENVIDLGVDRTVFLQKTVDHFIPPVEDDADVFISCLPWVFQDE